MNYENVEDTFPVIGKLIERAPELFHKSEMIGIFEASDICSSFLSKSDCLGSMTWYENFHFAKDSPNKQKLTDNFKARYNEMMRTRPNLKFEYVDGEEFKGHNDFTFIDTATDTIRKFFHANRHKLDTGWFAIPGFGRHIWLTENIIMLIRSGQITPVAICKDNIFCIVDRTKREEYVDAITQALDPNDYRLQDYEDIKYVNLQTGGYWHQRAGLIE